MCPPGVSSFNINLSIVSWRVTENIIGAKPSGYWTEEGIMYPEGLAPIMFFVTLHETMLKLMLKLETPGGHILLQGLPGVGKMSLARLTAHHTHAR
ncbi:hypothetical protein Pcinc_015044 [Petrolisthes cinctipes]|uniref:Uncharacterized protein n=1 Tax=Petrolisthes cinctipes TaxID=88211 RepID=A0AAE1FWI9_PETCI|nr:hypothetical protein Pcinc_015044 [Petrolisthes cinctipes]